LFDPKESILLRFAPNKEYVGKTISKIAETPEALDMRITKKF
jgi:hypothetical protein